MISKIFWLSILGLALAKPPSPIDSTASNIGDQQKQRNSRSIWPFTSSETTTEEPVHYPPSLPDNNDWFVKGETSLPQGIDLNKYPVWKVHKYNGIDLHPVKLQPENTYPPELHHVVDQGYSSGSSSSSDFSQNVYQNGYQDYGIHSTGYQSSSGPYPAEQDNYQTGEFHSSNFGPGNTPFNIQTQHKYEVYASPEHLQSVSGHHSIPSNSYGVPNSHNSVSSNYQGYNRDEQKHVKSSGLEQSQSSSGGHPDLSFLDDLGGLAPFLPEPTDENENAREEENEAKQEGFFEKLFSRFRGSPEATEHNSEITTTEKPTNSGGFLSSLFGTRSDTPLSVEPEASGSAISSMFYQPETERPAVVLPTTYYLPKTRGSYIAVKIPPTAASSFTPSIGQYSDISNIGFHEVPKVPFTQHEIPKISGPTLDSGYSYNLGHSEVRHSGFSGSPINSDYQSSIVHGQPHLPSPNVAPQFIQNYDNHHQSNFGPNSFSSSHGDVDRPHAEYMHSGDNGQQIGSPLPSSESSSATRNYQSQQALKDSWISEIHQMPSTAPKPQSEDESPKSFLNTMNSFKADEYDQNRDEKWNQNLNSQKFRYQNYNNMNSNFQAASSVQDTSDQNSNSHSFGQTVNANEPISAPQISDGFVPSLSYSSSSAEAGDEMNLNNNNQEYRQQTTSQDENDYSLGNSGATLNQDFIPNFVFNRDLVPPKENGPADAHQTSISFLQNPSNTPEPLQDYGILPLNGAVDFRSTPSDQEDEDARFITNLSALTSYGTPTNSYNPNQLAAASSDVRNIAISTPMKDEVNDGMNINTNKDVSRSTLPEQLPTKKVGQVIRKVMKRRNFAESNHSRRSAPERQAPTEETETTLIIRSEKDSIPEVRGGRLFHGTQIIDGYSNIQHQQHPVGFADTVGTANPVNPELEAVQQ